MFCLAWGWLSLSPISATAQTWSEWFSQKKTQKKYLIEQIAALKVYSEYLQKGYKIAKEGLGIIGDIKNGEFKLHDSFFESMKLVSPKVARYGKVIEIVKIQAILLNSYRQTIEKLDRQAMLNSNEKRYVQEVYGRLFDDCAKLLDDLVTVTTDSRLEMKDDERIERIDRLYDAMNDNLGFCRSFGNGALSLSMARYKQDKETDASRIINGIKN